MKKLYVLLFLLVSGFGFGQVNITGQASYALKIKGYVGADGSSCGDDITRGLQWIASKDINNNYKTIVQGTASYPNNGHGLTAQSFEPAIINFKDTEKIEQLLIRTTKRDKNGTCRSVQYSDASILVTTDNYNKYFDFAGLNLNQSGSIQINIDPIINLENSKLDKDIIGTKSTLIIPPIEGVLDKYYNWMYHIEGDVIAYTVYIPDPDPDCGGGSSPILRMSAKAVNPDEPPIVCPDIPITKYKDRWISLPIEYQNKNSLTIKCKDFLPYSVVGKNIQLKVNENGKPVKLRYRLSAPIVESFVATDSKCYDDTKGGSVRFVFDDTLMPGEQLNYSLIDLNAEGTPVSTGPIVIANDKSFVISNLSRGKYELQLIGFKDGLVTEVDTDTFLLQRFEIGSPTPVDFSLTKTDVSCNGDQDGTITISASGGTGKGYEYSIENGSWVPFLNKESTTETITGLHPLLSTDLDITYNIRIRDANKCVAKIQKVLENGSVELGLELSTPIKIKQPATPISLTNEPIFYKNPTFSGAENGSITVSFKGGTPINGNSYSFEWVNKNYTTEELTDKTSSQFSNGIYSIILSNVKEGTYFLTVKDANGCALNSVSEPKLEIFLNDPDPIKITLSETQSISCNSENTETDAAKFSDGILTATVEGGVPFDPIKNNGLLYKFVWSKFNVTTNQWDILEDYTTATAGNLSAGNYSLNVEDANGIVQGVYNTTVLETANPTTKTIAEPTKLELSFTSGNVSCHDGNNGWATATTIGGTGSYDYTWYNTNGGSIDQNKISQLPLDTYTVEVNDQKGCTITDSIEIKEPIAPVAIEYEEIFTPTFAGASNGRIIAKITGGTPNADLSYNYIWTNKAGVTQTTTTEFKNGIYTITLNGVPADDYFLTIKDKNYNEATNQISNCSILNSEVKLTEPDPLEVAFEIVHTISCNASNEFGNNKDTSPTDGQRDESQDGILVAHVTGGTPLASSSNNGLPYYFFWKKQQADGTWVALPNITSETASNLSHGNYALNIKDRNGIMLGTYTNNSLTQEIDVTQFMQEPSKLTVSITKGDVFCHGGNDGWATATVLGGTAPYNYEWTNGETIPNNTILNAGTYEVKIIDTKGCTTQASETIIEPLKPLLIETKEVVNPSFYKATNGKIVTAISGGTIFANNSYTFIWENSKGIEQNNTTTSFENGIYTIVLTGLPEETYSLTVYDANYNAAINKTGCTIVHTKIILEDPDPLEVTFEIVKSISCNASNDFGNETDAIPIDNQRDESQDGILKAHVKGGIPLQPNQNNGLPYYFTWKKKQKDGSWKTENNQDEIFENASEGTYALNIEDANGIKLGTYVNNLLDQEIDALQYIEQPTKLNLTFTKLNSSCNSGEDGWAEAHVSGGTSPYTYEWTNGATTARIENITTNNYFVIIKDAKGCSIQGSIFVGDPKGILTTDTYTNPTCNKGNDGSIQLNVTGGNLPYTYLWNTGATTKDISALTAGNYEVTITCPDCCVYKKKWTLKDPEPVVVDLGLDKTLCKDQVLELNTAIADPKATYNWTATNGFTFNEAIISLSKAGTYHLKVTSGLGCIGEDEIVIKTSQAAISAEFLVSSQAYLDEEVILINTSTPFGESTNWVIPNGVKIIEQKEKYITLKFDAIGLYTIGLLQTQGDCFATYTKNVTVEKRSTSPNTTTSSQFIIDFVVAPNPSDGNFKAIIALENSSAINLRLFTSSGELTSIQKKETGLKKYEVDFKTALAAGMYILVLETEQQTLVKKIIIY